MNVFVYANVNLNLIDGSTIWVQSVTEVLSKFLDCKVTVLSRDPIEGRGVIPALQKLANVRVLAYTNFVQIASQHPKRGDPYGIEKIVKHLDAESGIDRMLVRDPDVSLVLARVQGLRSRLWAYVLDSFSLNAFDDRSRMGELVDKAGGVIVQTDTQRGLLEAVFPKACNKTSVLPPMVVPIDIESLPEREESPAGPVRFVYSGKYSKDWNVEAFFDIPAACAEAGFDATITMIGDKVHNEKSDPGFRGRIMEKFQNTPGVTWLGAMDREAAIAELSRNDLGLCWRTDALNDSLEISTKFLEFASVGVPSVVNRTAAYEALLGADYPYFADTMPDVIAAAANAAKDPGLYAEMRARSRALAQGFSYEQAGERLRRALRVGELLPRVKGARPRKLLIASHDLKFLDAAIQRLSESNRYQILHDDWRSTTTHDETKSAGLLKQADVIFCEWCVGQAVWYSQRKLPHQKLFVRLHRFEAFTRFPQEVAAGAIDGVIVVSDHFRDICVNEFGWPAEKIVVLPQYCIADQLNRQKHPGAELTLGFVGINGFQHKRFDRAIQILRLVRKKIPQFRMRIRSAMPWDFTWIWKDNPVERAKFEAVFGELHRDPDLRDAIIFDRPGANMAEWYRHIGYLLSTSESEGCHTSVAEGICSGAVPVVIDWPGATSVYGEECVHETVEAMAKSIIKSFKAGGGDADERREWGARDFDITRTVDHLDRWFSAPAVQPKRLEQVA